MSDYVNRVHDPGLPGMVRWTTVGSPDDAGGSYPGPSAFGATSDYTVETIIPGGGGAVGTATEVLETAQLTNDQGVTIFQGAPVYSSGDLLVKLASATATVVEATVVGFVNQTSILNAASGDIATQGTITIPAARQEGVWGAGDKIYVSKTTAGDLTNVVPVVDGEFDAFVAVCNDVPAGGDARVTIHISDVLEYLPTEFV